MNIKEAQSSVGRRVIYKPTGEEGVITSANDWYAFVRYGADTHSKATRPEDLRLVSSW
jgi:hypothetical protein